METKGRIPIDVTMAKVFSVFFQMFRAPNLLPSFPQTCHIAFDRDFLQCPDHESSFSILESVCKWSCLTWIAYCATLFMSGQKLLWELLIGSTATVCFSLQADWQATWNWKGTSLTYQFYPSFKKAAPACCLLWFPLTEHCHHAVPVLLVAVFWEHSDKAATASQQSHEKCKRPKRERMGAMLIWHLQLQGGGRTLVSRSAPQTQRFS